MMTKQQLLLSKGLTKVKFGAAIAVDDRGDSSVDVDCEDVGTIIVVTEERDHVHGHHITIGLDTGQLGFFVAGVHAELNNTRLKHASIQHVDRHLAAGCPAESEPTDYQGDQRHHKD